VAAQSPEESEAAKARPAMKTEIECVRAHDLIVGILLDKEMHDELTPEIIQRMTLPLMRCVGF
jgi:hypothetical protein